jgi:DNA-directed RNA polymerase omega subunit
MKIKDKAKREEPRASIFKTVVTAATRAIELNEGSKKLVDAKPEESVLGVALKEIAEGKVSYKIKKGK